MAEAKKTKFKFSSFVAPKGIAKYAWLDKPDPYQEAKGKTQYSLRLLLEDTTEVREWIEKVYQKALAEAKASKTKLKAKHHVAWVFPEDVDPEDFEVQEGYERPKYDEDHKGRIWLTLRSAYSPAQIGTKRDDSGAFIGLDEGVKIMSGDIVKPKFFVNPYEGVGSGISFRLSVVQLIKKNTRAGAVRDDDFETDDEDDDEIPF